MSKLFSLDYDDVAFNRVCNSALYRIYLDRRTLPTVSYVGWFAAVLSAFALDGLSVLQTLLPYLDGGPVVALRRATTAADHRQVHYFCAQLLFTAGLYAALPVALLVRQEFVWQALQSWNQVGLALQLASVAYTGTLCLPSLVSRAALGICFKVAIADVRFSGVPEQEALNMPGQEKNTLQPDKN